MPFSCKSEMIPPAQTGINLKPLRVAKPRLTPIRSGDLFAAKEEKGGVRIGGTDDLCCSHGGTINLDQLSPKRVRFEQQQLLTNSVAKDQKGL